MIVLSFFIIYMGELYKIAPGWGPVARYDSDGTDDLLIRQQLVAAHKAGKGGANDGAKARVQRDIWERDPGEKRFHPVYGSVTVRPNFAKLQEARAADPFAPRDEVYFQQQRGVGGAGAGADGVGGASQVYIPHHKMTA